jgi:hypothetical protein
VLIERQDPTKRGAILNLAEVELFDHTGARFPQDKLNASMSSSTDTFPATADKCVDGLIPDYGAPCEDPTTCQWNFCRTNETNDSSPWLQIKYPCAAGLSRVEVYNRLDQDQDRILDFQMRILDPTNATGSAPYIFDAVPTGRAVYSVSGNGLAFQLYSWLLIMEGHN